MGDLTGAKTGSRLRLSIWHPNCWMLAVTADRPGGLVADGVYVVEDRVHANVVAFGDTTADIDALVDAARDSDLTYSVWELNDRQRFGEGAEAPGNATRHLLVEYDPANSVHEPFVSRGFIPDEPIIVRGGREYWTVVVREVRGEVRERLDDVRTEIGAEVTVEEITTPEAGEPLANLSALSARQREVFDLARDRGYYDWPRRVSGGDLATELGISKATLFEHLRKAEAKLLAPKESVSGQ